jgi:hypothetical protein
MLLKEMFSPIGAPKDDQSEIDWLGDLKFYIDNNDDMLDKHFFPAIEKHKKYHKHPEVYKLYIKPIERMAECYCEEFDVENKEEKFPKDKLIELAKSIADEQDRHIERGDYETK